jgi:hypothetical protein
MGVKTPMLQKQYLPKRGAEPMRYLQAALLRAEERPKPGTFAVSAI